MPSKHKHTPIPFRPPEGDRSWLQAYAEATGMAVNAVLVAALGEYRARHGGSTPVVSPPPSGATTQPGGTTTTKPPQPQHKRQSRHTEPCPHPRARVIKGLCGNCGTNVS